MKSLFSKHGFLLISLILVIQTFAQKCPTELFVFVGEKISVEKKAIFTRGNFMGSDLSFLAKYKVIQKVYGQVEVDTIEFIAFDHYGFPPFAAYKTVILYLSCSEDGKWYQQKYQYNPVYKTTDGRWAGPTKTDYYSKKQDTSIRHEKIQLLAEEWHDYKGSLFRDTYEEIDIFKGFSEDENYFIFGNYAKDLFEIKKKSVLKSRGFF